MENLSGDFRSIMHGRTWMVTRIGLCIDNKEKKISTK